MLFPALNISKVSYQVGLKSPKHFTRLFKRKKMAYTLRVGCQIFHDWIGLVNIIQEAAQILPLIPLVLLPTYSAKEPR